MQLKENYIYTSIKVGYFCISVDVVYIKNLPTIIHPREVLKKLMVAKYFNLQHLDEELQLLKAAAEMVFDGQHPVEFYIEQLNGKVEAKRHKLKELESEW